jgi:hypothetical protein
VGQIFVCPLSIYVTDRLKSVPPILSSPFGAEPKRREPLIPTRAVEISGITPVAEERFKWLRRENEISDNQFKRGPKR